jgi:hypothetical protein
MASIPKSALPLVNEASKSARAEFPFWNSSDDAVTEEGMYQLAFELDVEDVRLFLSGLPIGYSIVHWIFTWEDRRANGGFTGTETCGVESVHEAANGYEHVGMAEEAAALRAMLKQYTDTPMDYERIEAAFNSIPNPYKNDWDRIPNLVKILCGNAEKYFYEK